MKTTIVSALIATTLVFATTQNVALSHGIEDSINYSKLQLDNLRKDKLEGTENTEVIVSKVVIPPHTKLPKHWHPGEEFAYIIAGSVTLLQDGKPDILGKEGDVIKVPLKQVHTASTSDSGAVILVFRVHEIGKQERYLVD